MAGKSAGKKAKAPIKSVAKHDQQKKGGKAEKGGAIGSFKKMLGLNPAKGGAPASKASVKGSKATTVAQSLKEKEAQPAKGKGPGKAEAKKASKGQSLLSSLNDLRPSSLRSQESISGSGPVCREVACELMSTTGGYCRMHYIKNWKKIKRKEMILKEKKLNSYIEELVSKYPDKYIEAIRQDLASEKDFAKVIADLEIDEGLDDFESVETESAEGLIDNIKRDFDDEGDVF